ncbi:MAG: TonB-dependent receptor, partial [Bacteroidota bacterium]
MKHFYCLLLLFFIQQLSAQKTIYGYVQDSSNGERLIGAFVKLINEEGSTSANNYGYFSLKSMRDTAYLYVSQVGYDSKLIPVHQGTELPLNITLRSVFVLKGVKLSSRKDEKIVNSTQMSTISMNVQQIKMMPRFMGEADIIKAIQLMPGIKGGSEGSTGLYVRGGGPDQNLILLDGAPVYNASHLFGFFSIFNTDAINHVQILKGGFPARYGGRLSSVLDITMKEGNMKRFRAEGSVGALASKLTLEGPIKKDKASFMISGRRTYLDFLLQPIFQLANGNSSLRQGYFFSDMNAKINWKVNKTNRLYLSYYTGKDKFYVKSKPYSYLYDGKTISDQSEDRNQWGNQLGGLRWNKVLNKDIFINTQLNHTKYYYEIVQSASSSEANDTATIEQMNYSGFTSSIRDISLRSDAEINRGHHYIRTGLSVISHTFI